MRQKVGFLAAVAALMLVVGVATATAGSGNSANAKQCQKNGWQHLFTSTGGTFASEEACVSYAAQGNTILTTNPNPFPGSKALCESLGGTFGNDMQTAEEEAGLTPLWTCNGSLAAASDFPNGNPMWYPCLTDGGGGTSGIIAEYTTSGTLGVPAFTCFK